VTTPTINARREVIASLLGDLLAAVPPDRAEYAEFVAVAVGQQIEMLVSAVVDHVKQQIEAEAAYEAERVRLEEELRMARQNTARSLDALLVFSIESEPRVTH
jgi:hypothetical protein